MRRKASLSVLAAVITTLIGGISQDVAAALGKDLVFEGVVQSIRSIDNGERSWLVTMTVKRVTSGEFSGSTFQFAVHSPAKSGLEEGQSYTVEARWKDGGYVVDELQWRRPRRLGTGTRPAVPANMALNPTGLRPAG
jgi:hypothetical protein